MKDFLVFLGGCVLALPLLFPLYLYLEVTIKPWLP